MVRNAARGPQSRRPGGLGRCPPTSPYEVPAPAIALRELLEDARAEDVEFPFAWAASVAWLIPRVQKNWIDALNGTRACWRREYDEAPLSNKQKLSRELLDRMAESVSDGRRSTPV
jgi:hypothetical protein